MIGVGTRWQDFTTASRTLFADPRVAFVNLNTASFDAAKQAGVSLVADARAVHPGPGRRTVRLVGRTGVA